MIFLKNSPLSIFNTNGNFPRGGCRLWFFTEGGVFLRKSITFASVLALFDSFNGQLKSFRTMDFQTQIAHNETAEWMEPRSAVEIQYELERNKPMPSNNHAKVQYRMCKQLGKYDTEFDILPELSIDFPTKPAVPDIAIYPIAPDDWNNDSIKRTDLPLLVIEILSPKQAFDDILDKIKNIYFPAGLKSVWVVLPPGQSVMIFKPNEKPKTFDSGIMLDKASGFEVDLDKIF
jgi:Uma2 family endonuclease